MQIKIIRNRILSGIFFLFVLLLAGGCAMGKTTRQIPAVSSFDLKQYLGTWYEIARLPHSFESGMDRVSAEYTLRKDGRINILNSGWKNGVRKQIEGVAEPKGAPGIGELRVSFFRPFYGDYRIILLAPDYSSAVVTSSTMNYLWILARKPTLQKSILEKYLQTLNAMGFDTAQLIFNENSFKANLPK